MYYRSGCYREQVIRVDVGSPRMKCGVIDSATVHIQCAREVWIGKWRRSSVNLIDTVPAVVKLRTKFMGTRYFVCNFFPSHSSVTDMTAVKKRTRLLLRLVYRHRNYLAVCNKCCTSSKNFTKA